MTPNDLPDVWLAIGRLQEQQNKYQRQWDLFLSHIARIEQRLSVIEAQERGIGYDDER